MAHRQLDTYKFFMRSVLALSTGVQRLISRIGGGISDEITYSHYENIAPHREVRASSVRGSLFNPFKFIAL